MTTELRTIPYVRKVHYAPYASLPIVGLKVGDFGYATDRKVLYRWNGSSYDALTIHSSSGLAADIPNAADLPHGSIYNETDSGFTKQVQSGAWATIAGLSPSGLIAMWHGTIANIPSGWIICDGNNGTPNLLGKFVEGVATAATDPGATGGSQSKNTVGHSHNDAGHLHTNPDTAGDAGGQVYGYPGAEVSVSVPGHIHAQANTGTAYASISSQNDGINDIRPPYYDVAFIMKT